MSTLYVYTEKDLQRFVAPRLLSAPVAYDQRFMDQYSNVLRLYFNQLDSFNNQLRTQALSPISDGTGIYFPNGQFASTATQTALDLKAPIANPTFTGTVQGVSKSHVGLGSVDNTSDAQKPVSTATQAALDA